MKKNKEFKPYIANMEFDLEFFKLAEPDEWIVIQRKYGLGRYAAQQKKKEKEDIEQ